MKRFIFRSLMLLVLLVLLAALAVHLFLDGAIKRAVETIGPRIAKVSITLDSFSLSLLSGSGSIKGLVVGNPEGFKSPSAIQVSLASLTLEPPSLISDKIIVRSVNVQGPEISFETTLKGNNLKTILANLEQAAGPADKQPAAPAEPSTKPAKKLEVDELKLTGGKVHVNITALGTSQSATVLLPEISLKDLGKGPEGITPAELSRQVLQVVIEKAIEQSGSVVADIGKGAQYLSRDLGTNSTEKAAKSLGDLLKKK